MESLKRDLQQLRAESVPNLNALKSKLLRTLTKLKVPRGLKLKTFQAKNSVEAVKYIKSITKVTSKLSVNRSSTVQELIPELQKAGFEIDNTYVDELKLQDLKGEDRPNYWEAIKLPDAMIWDSLSTSRFTRLAPQPRSSGSVGLLGINAISAESGNIFLVQHLHNITKIIADCSKLVCVVGLEKILKTDTEALFQAKCCGLFGVENILTELLSKRAGDERAATKPTTRAKPKAAKTLDYHELSLPTEIHVIILDNGRTALGGSKFVRLLDCIGCKSCSRMCPRVRKLTVKTSTPDELGAPTNPRDILLFGFIHGLSYAAEHGLYDCTTCGNCEELCPVDIPLPELTLNMRELCLKEDLAPGIYKKISENIEARGNPYLSA
ncbi:MAG: lactate utilization protein [Thermoplasmata archaeon]|nr:lactate utilization protein [Thermoplasmata archaeon]